MRTVTEMKKGNGALFALLLRKFLCCVNNTLSLKALKIMNTLGMIPLVMMIIKGFDAEIDTNVTTFRMTGTNRNSNEPANEIADP